MTESIDREPRVVADPFLGTPFHTPDEIQEYEDWLDRLDADLADHRELFAEFENEREREFMENGGYYDDEPIPMPWEV